VSLALLDDHARHCVVDATEENREEMTDEMMGAVGRLIRAR
jgi:DNA-binding FrmR family transcriptional regulator